MMFGGNIRAQVFFKQHGWTDGGNIEAKYTSRAADLYRQILAKEVAKAIAEDATSGLPSSPVAASQLPEASNGVSSYAVKEELPSKESYSVKHDAIGVTSSPKASNTVVPTTFKKPIGAKKTGKGGGFGARKLTTKPTRDLYDQKPEEVAPVIPVASSIKNGGIKLSAGSSYASWFEYNDDMQSGGQSVGGTQVLSHVAPPKVIELLCGFRNGTVLTPRNQKLRLKNRMKQERSSQTQSPFLLLSTLGIRTKTLILNQKLLFRSFH